MDLGTLTADTAIAEQLRTYLSKIDDMPDAEEFRTSLGLLPLPQMVEETGTFRSFRLVEMLGGIILDDPGTSNHHMLIGASPLAGMVFYLSHDGGSRVVFDDLAAYLAATEVAFEAADFLDEHHPAHAPLAADQAGLHAFLADVGSQDDGDEAIVPLLPSLDLSDPDFLIALIGDDFMIGEAVAEEITRRPAEYLLSVAQFCESFPHPQVSRPGAKALQAIAAL
ncbi:hypothetical protein GAO09_29125 [Rhizobiales bacterium RZME27]|uniref:Uncharacterized protein n=1 Tax=Endobacterium cereale TaxID=2663029 RepID=A0A6A8AJN4_9HYPH|nr:hypothetical protein [Endobacterium cereale]MEB2845746.1 hypothetical protein [Endobacterium cereale]MQY50097.1 hypothetical protein [Endobacterium cereale]